MNFRLRVAAWFSGSVVLLAATLIFSAHFHLDEELRKDRWDRSHPKFPNWVIHGSYTDEEVHDILGELLKVWLWVGIPVLLLSILVGFAIAKQSVRPIRKINQELALVDFKTFQRGIYIPENDPELASLVQHINSLLGRLRMNYLEIERFSSKVAHELRTPLTILRMKTEAAATRLPPDFSEDFEEEISRLSRLVETLLLTAKAEGGSLEPKQEPVNLTELLNDLQEGYDLLAADRDMRVEWEVMPGLIVQSDRELLCQIFHNLLGNAVRHGRSCMRVSARARARAVRVVISNIAGNQEQNAAGTGQGLRLVKALIANMPSHSLKLRNSLGGFCVVLALPQEEQHLS